MGDLLKKEKAQLKSKYDALLKNEKALINTKLDKIRAELSECEMKKKFCEANKNTDKFLMRWAFIAKKEGLHTKKPKEDATEDDHAAWKDATCKFRNKIDHGVLGD